MHGRKDVHQLRQRRRALTEVRSDGRANLRLIRDEEFQGAIQPVRANLHASGLPADERGALRIQKLPSRFPDIH
jgi:hypothetical protein